MEGSHTMSDRPGLSIFDDPDDSGPGSGQGAGTGRGGGNTPGKGPGKGTAPRARQDPDEATQVIPAVSSDRTPGRPPAPAAGRPAPAGAPARPVMPPAAPDSSTERPSFPVVRRGGYDTAAVDRQMS